MVLSVLGFAACTAAIIIAGTFLSRYADVLAEKTGIGKGWIGMTAVGIATSLPELSAGISSVTYAGSVNLALGDALGSCVFNLAIVALIDFLSKDEPRFFKIGPGNLIAAGFGVAIIGTALLGLLMEPYIPFTFLHVSFFSVAIVILYLLASRLIFIFEKKEISKFIRNETESLKYGEITLGKTALVLLLSVAAVAVAGTLLPRFGVKIAEETGYGRGFIGSVFMAFATSLPEVVVSITAVRMGSLEIAHGNLLGSNLFNCVILAIDDVVYTKGTIFAEAAPGQAVTATVAIVMTGVLLIGHLYAPRRKAFMRLGWDSLALIGLYLFNTVSSYYLSGGS